MNRFTATLLVILFSLTGCLPANLPLRPAGTPTASAQAPTPIPTSTTGQAGTPSEPEPTALPFVETPFSSNLTPELLKNFTYWMNDFNTKAALKDGIYSDDKIDTRLIEPVALGDINGDGRQDAAVILATNSGGSGTFFDLIALLDQDGTVEQAAFSYIGDRQAVKNLQIVGGRIILDYLTQGLNDPLCCPGEHRLRSYLLENTTLRLASEQVLDSPTAQATPLPDEILIDQPEMSSQLTTPLLVRGRVSRVPTEKKLAYYVTNLNAAQLAQGEIPLQGEPGGPGTFEFELNLGAVSPTLLQLEIVDSASGTLLGRSIVVLIAQ